MFLFCKDFITTIALIAYVHHTSPSTSKSTYIQIKQTINLTKEKDYANDELLKCVWSDTRLWLISRSLKCCIDFGSMNEFPMWPVSRSLDYYIDFKWFWDCEWISNEWALVLMLNNSLTMQTEIFSSSNSYHNINLFIKLLFSFRSFKI